MTFRDADGVSVHLLYPKWCALLLIPRSARSVVQRGVQRLARERREARRCAAPRPPSLPGADRSYACVRVARIY